MNGLRAALWKDLRLFRSGTGLAAVLLPVLLLICLRFGMGDALRQRYVTPFPIAVRDEDGTVMSRSLMGQMEQVPLFSQVVRAGDEPDKALLDQGCAAVVTIPKDFFYTMYHMDNRVVTVSLNANMPLEASVFRAMFGSVMGIIASDQAAGRAAFEFCYGGLSPEETSQMWEETSRQILSDALGRHQIFEEKETLDGSADALERRVLACTLSMLCLFFPLSAVKTLPEELASGIYPRYLAAGGKRWAFLLSKLFVAGLLAVPALLLVLLAFGPERWGMTLLLSGLLFLGGFVQLLCMAAWAGEASTAQRWGNLLLLLSLVLGGVLYGSELLPAPARFLGELTLPRWAAQGLDAVERGAGGRELLAALWPAWVESAVLLALSIPALRRAERRIGKQFSLYARDGKNSEQDTDGGGKPDEIRLPLLSRILALTGMKLRAMSGGISGLIGLVVVCTICGGLAAGALNGTGAESLRVGIVLEEEDALSLELVQRLEEQEGLAVMRIQRDKAGMLLSAGKVEGVLWVGEGYEAGLLGETTAPLRYESAAGSSSGQAVREIVAGQAAVQRARLRGVASVESRLNRALEEREKKDFAGRMEAIQDGMGPLYEVQEEGGTAFFDGSLPPSRLGLAALIVFLTEWTWAAWCGSPDSRRVERRLLTLPGGGVMSYGADVLALFLVGVLSGGSALLAGGGGDGITWAAFLLYTLCAAGAALTLARWGAASGRMDTLAPFAALVTCLVGGCFGELAGLSPVLRWAALLTPQGLAIHAARGRPAAFAALILAVAVLLALGAPWKSGSWMRWRKGAR